MRSCDFFSKKIHTRWTQRVFSWFWTCSFYRWLTTGPSISSNFLVVQTFGQILTLITTNRSTVHYNCTMVHKYCNVSSVVEFQRWWVLKSKLFAQESTYSKEILIPTTLNHLWFSVVGVLKVDYLDFPCEIFEILCELDVGVIACIF